MTEYRRTATQTQARPTMTFEWPARAVTFSLTLTSVLRLLFTVLVVWLGCAAASRGDQSQIGEWGLIQALPVLYFVSLALLTVSFFWEVFRPVHANRLLLAVHVIGLVLLLHGAPALLEHEPRFATAWLHAGFTDQIFENGVTRPEADARFNWPGFFGAGAAVTGAGGLETALTLVRWAPVVMVLLYLPPLYMIGKHLTGSATATWVGLWLFLVVNWVGQDYYAPQSLGFLLYLVAIAIIVTFFRDGPQLPIGSRLSRWRDRLWYDGFPDLATGPRTRVALVLLLVLLAATLAMSHQLTPIMLVIASTALVLVGRFRLLVFPVIAGILTLGWISVGATPYWTGHLEDIFGGVGNVGDVLGTSVGERIIGSEAHVTLVRLRLAFTGVVWLLMALSVIVLWVRSRPPLTLAALAVAPFLMLVQNYGDEGVLRIFLFSSAFASLLIAQMLVGFVVHRPVRVLVAAGALAAIPLFLLTRYGNESFEQVRPHEVEAIRELYDIAPVGSNVVSPTSQVPWRFDLAVDYDYSRPLEEEGFIRGELHAVRAPVGSNAVNEPGTYLLITTSQELYASEALGARPDWFDRLRPRLTPANGYRLLYENPDAVIYEFGSRP